MSELRDILHVWNSTESNAALPHAVFASQSLPLCNKSHSPMSVTGPLTTLMWYVELYSTLCKESKGKLRHNSVLWSCMASYNKEFAQFWKWEWVCTWFSHFASSLAHPMLVLLFKGVTGAPFSTLHHIHHVNMYWTLAHSNPKLHKLEILYMKWMTARFLHSHNLVKKKKLESWLCFLKCHSTVS